MVAPESKWAIHNQAEADKNVEGWTSVCCNILGRVVNRNERLIKLADSWFSAKYMKV